MTIPDQHQSLIALVWKLLPAITPGSASPLSPRSVGAGLQGSGEASYRNSLHCRNFASTRQKLYVRQFITRSHLCRTPTMITALTCSDR